MTADDVRRYPELTLARRAARGFSPAQRAGPVVYTSIEPCPIWAGVIANAGLGAVVHPVSQAAAADRYGRDAFLRSAAVYDGVGSRVRVGGPVLPDAGASVHREHRLAGGAARGGVTRTT